MEDGCMACGWNAWRNGVDAYPRKNNISGAKSGAKAANRPGPRTKVNAISKDIFEKAKSKKKGTTESGSMLTVTVCMPYIILSLSIFFSTSSVLILGTKGRRQKSGCFRLVHTTKLKDPPPQLVLIKIKVFVGGIFFFLPKVFVRKVSWTAYLW